MGSKSFSRQIKNCLTFLFLVFVLQVFYIGVGFWFLNHDDISQAEKKIIVVTS